MPHEKQQATAAWNSYSWHTAPPHECPICATIAWSTRCRISRPSLVVSDHTVSQSWLGAPSFHLCRRIVHLCTALSRCTPLTKYHFFHSKSSSLRSPQVHGTVAYWWSVYGAHAHKWLLRNLSPWCHMKLACTICVLLADSCQIGNLNRQCHCIFSYRKSIACFALTAHKYAFLDKKFRIEPQSNASIRAWLRNQIREEYLQ